MHFKGLNNMGDVALTTVCILEPLTCQISAGVHTAASSM